MTSSMVVKFEFGQNQYTLPCISYCKDLMNTSFEILITDTEAVMGSLMGILGAIFISPVSIRVYSRDLIEGDILRDIMLEEASECRISDLRVSANLPQGRLSISICLKGR